MDLPAFQDAAATQEDVFRDLQPFVTSTLSGINAAIITYGELRMHASGHLHQMVEAQPALLIGRRVPDGRLTTSR